MSLASQRSILMCIFINPGHTKHTAVMAGPLVNCFSFTFPFCACFPAEHVQTWDACKWKRAAHLITTAWHSKGLSEKGRTFTGRNPLLVQNVLRPGATGCRLQLRPIPCTLIRGDRVRSRSTNEPIMQRSQILLLLLLFLTTFCIIAFTCTSLSRAVADYTQK